MLSLLLFIVLMDKYIKDTHPGDNELIYVYEDDGTMMVDTIDKLQDVANK